MTATDIIVTTVCPLLGVLISNAMFLSPWSLVMTARKNRHLGNVNPVPFALMFINNLGYCVYGAMLSNYYVFFSSVFGVLLSLFYTITCLTIMAKEAFEDEFTKLYLQLEGLVLGGIGFWAIIGIVQTSLFNSFADPEAQRTQMVGYICCFFNICYYAAPLSTMAEIVKNKDCSSLFLPNILINCLNATLWLCYGLFGVSNIVIWGPSAIGLTLSLIQVGLVVRYHKGHWLEAISGWVTHRTIQMKSRLPDDSDEYYDPERGLVPAATEGKGKNYGGIVAEPGLSHKASFIITPSERSQQISLQISQKASQKISQTVSTPSSSQKSSAPAPSNSGSIVTKPDSRV